MATVPTSRLLPEELQLLGFKDPTQIPATVEIPDLGPSVKEVLRPAVGKVDTSRIPEPSEEVKRAAARIEAGQSPAEPVEDPVSADDRLAFLVHLMGGAPFRKSYAYYGGKVRITLRTRTALEDELCTRECARLPAGTQPVEYIRHYDEFTFLFSIEEIALEDQPPARFALAEAIKAEPLAIIREKILAGYSSAVFNMVRGSYREFKDLYDTLMSRRNDPSF